MALDSTDLPHNLIAFVTDPISEQSIKNVIKESTLLAYSETYQGSIPDVINFLKTNRTPKVLLVDLSNSDLPISDVQKIREFCAPTLNVVCVGARNDVGLYRDLAAIGVFEYIVKPLNNVIVRKTLEDAINNKKTFIEKKGKMINFISSVGGAGATTIATNVAWILANFSFKRTLLMDMDFLFGTSNILLDLKAENAYLDVLESSDKIDDYFVETIWRKAADRLFYLGGLCDLMRGVIVDIDAFKALTNIVKMLFNYVVLDSQKEPSMTTKVGLDASDFFAIVVEMSLASAQNTARILEFFETDQAGKKVIIIANKIGISGSGALSREAFEKVIGRNIDFFMPFDSISPLACANIGQPLANSDCPVTDVLKSIVDEILGKHEIEIVKENVEQKEGISLDIQNIKEKIWELLSKNR